MIKTGLLGGVFIFKSGEKVYNIRHIQEIQYSRSEVHSKYA
jgi:hypothetical protein